MEDLTTAMARAADTLSESLAQPCATGSQTRYGTVVANNGSTLDVAMAGGTVTGVLMTTACCSAVAGDRVLLDVTGPLVTATGILANSGNGPYVKLLWSGSAAAGTTIALAGVAEWAIIGVKLGGDAAVLPGARCPDNDRCQYHCGAMVTGATSYWAALSVYDTTVRIDGVGSQGGSKVTRIYGFLKG